MHIRFIYVCTIKHSVYFFYMFRLCTFRIFVAEKNNLLIYLLTQFMSDINKCLIRETFYYNFVSYILRNIQ